MLGDITESQFKLRIQRADKAREKEARSFVACQQNEPLNFSPQAAIEAIFRMFIDVATDLMRGLIVNRNVEEFNDQHAWLFVYSNSQLDDIRDCYRTKVPRLTELEVLYI